MTSLATARIARIGRVSDLREVGPVNYERCSSDHGWELVSHMHLMDHDLQVKRAPGGRVHILLSVAEHAHFDPAAASAVPRQLIMAGITARGFDHVVNLGYLRAIGHEVKLSAGIVRAQIKSSQNPRCVDADGVRGGRVEPA